MLLSYDQHISIVLPSVLCPIYLRLFLALQISLFGPVDSLHSFWVKYFTWRRTHFMMLLKWPRYAPIVHISETWHIVALWRRLLWSKLTISWLLSYRRVRDALTWVLELDRRPTSPIDSFISNFNVADALIWCSIWLSIRHRLINRALHKCEPRFFLFLRLTCIWQSPLKVWLDKARPQIHDVFLRAWDS